MCIVTQRYEDITVLVVSDSNQTLTTSQGTISRYLNQTSVHQERHTAWCIKPYSPLPFQFLVVRFTRFTFHASNINSYLEVLDGCKESAPSLGRFSSTQSPLGRSITSSTSQLFVLLHFDDRIGTYDFEFNYHIWSPTVSSTAEMKTPSHPPTSITSHSPYTSYSKVTSLPLTTLEQTTTKYFTKSTFSRSSHYNNFTIPTNSTINHLYSHGNNIKTRLLLYTLLPTGGLVIIIGIAVILVRRRRKRIAYSRLTSLSIDEIVSELNENMDECDRLELNTSCAVLQVTSEEHQTETGMSQRTSREHTSFDSDDEMIRLDRNPPDFPSTELQNVNTSPRTSAPCGYESDPVPDHSSHVTNEELRQLHENDDEDKMSEAERIALTRLFGEDQQDQYHLPKPKPTVPKDQASDC
ncbi:uncharacterized protein LOC116301694 isoform X2 [Actinia tenebrosa]|uniref:Uncharacterized protein LOC116301694 isoform X2 n=1 Tax=Actinia tenebrosa TaxID=6105 RepID=A0A6P8IIR6_ACTTE|nr:uncharacterized protein LOC116301694 isoform X2 [Actinia tenebrosa]